MKEQEDTSPPSVALGRVFEPPLFPHLRETHTERERERARERERGERERDSRLRALRAFHWNVPLKERIFIERMTSDHKRKASTVGSK